MTENFANHYITTLAARIIESDLTVTVDSVTGIPARPFRAVIGRKGAFPEEIVVVTGLTGTTLTITRAAEATAGVQTAWKHPVGATLTAALTAAAMTTAFASGLALSELDAVVTPATTDLLLVSQGGNSKKLTRSQMVAANVLDLPGGSDAAAIVTKVNAILAAMKAALLMDADPPSYESVILGTSGLVGYWRLGEPSGVTANDEVSTHDGTYRSSPTLGATGLLAGNADTAMTVAAGGQNVLIADFAGASIATTGELSLEAWIKPTNLTGTHTIISKSGWNPGNTYEYWLETNNATLFFEVHAGTSSVVASAASAAVFTSGQTYHVAATFDSGTLGIIYVNGVEVARDDTWTGSVTDTAGDVAIGVREVTGAGGFIGTMDEVAIYSRVLTPAEVLAHYEAGS